jgi:hypothetical protein
VNSRASTSRFADRAVRCALAAIAALLWAGAPAASAQSSLAPSLSVDQAFAPTTGGVARDGGAGTGTEIPGGVAAYGDRIYTVGESNGEVAVIARRSTGSYDSSFGGGDGRVDLGIGNGKDVGMAIVALPDGSLRVLAKYDADTTSSTNLDVAVLGLTPAGGYDASFGGGDGIVTFPVGVIDDEASRMVADEAGRLAITGWRKDAGGKEDMFVALLEANGSPTLAFDGDGIRTIDRAGALKNDRGIDIAWRPGGGVVVLAQVATNPDTNVNNYISVLHALTATGADDTGFSDDGDLELAVGEPNTIPGGLLAYGGRLWATGSTKVGADTDAFLARVQDDGSGLVSRRFDMRGTQIAADQVVVSGGGDLDVLPGASPTLVVVGSTTYNSRTFWSAAAFNDFDGDLAQAGFGDLLVPTNEYGALLGVQAAGDALAVTGSLLDVNGSFDTSFGTLRLKVDADKQCDLAIDMPSPLEARFTGDAPIAATINVTNEGLKTCAGQITVPAGYSLAMGGQLGALSTGPLGPAATFASAGATLAYSGPRRREDTISVRVTAPGDVAPDNDVRLLHVLFAWCDVALQPGGGGRLVPNEGSRRFEFVVRNVGSGRCRGVQLAAEGGGRTSGTPDRYALPAGRSVEDGVSARLASRALPGARVELAFRAAASGDIDAANNVVRIGGRVIGVGDSDVLSAGRRAIAGRAHGGRGPIAAKRLSVTRVDVAIRRLGSGCRWLASKRSGRFLSVGGGKCRPARWLRAGGARRWRLALGSPLPPGSYEVLSRARIRVGFREGRFSARDRTRVRFTVR